MIYASRSERGRREKNEDSIYTPVRGGMPLIIVADGMGGHSAGERASEIAVSAAVDKALAKAGESPQRCLFDAVNEANREVYEYALNNLDCRGMGTTMVAALIYDGSYFAANVGDSRLYRISDAGMEQVTVDHSLVEELVEAGYITRSEALHHPRRNIITRALGTAPQVRVDIFDGDWAKGDILLLCSDGFYEVVSEEETLRVIRENDDLQAACDSLVKLAMNNGSADNISVVLAKNGGGDDA